MVTTAGYDPLSLSEQGLPELVVRPYHACVFAQDEYYCNSLSSPVLHKGKKASAGDLYHIFFFGPSRRWNKPWIEGVDREGTTMQ